MDQHCKSFSLKMNKRGQTGGLITALVFGVASLVIGVIIAFVIVSTLTGAGLLSSNRPTVAVANEGATTLAFCNDTGYTLLKENSTTQAFAITGIMNATTDGLGIYNWTITGTSANCTVTDAGVVTNGSSLQWNNVSLNYTYQSMTEEEMSADRMSLNFTEGVDNVSSKLPTVLLIAAIVLILSIMAILVGVWQRMRMGGGSGL